METTIFTDYRRYMPDAEGSESSGKLSPRPYPLPTESREAFRTFLNRVNVEVFGDNASGMARALGIKGASGKRALRRTLSGKVDKVSDEIVEMVWTYLLDEFGIDAYKFAPTPYGVAILPRLVHRPAEEGGSFVVKSSQEGYYVIDSSEIGQGLPLISGQYFVATIEGDAMEPELMPGHQVAVEPVEDPMIVHTDGIYLFRLEDSIHIRRLQTKPNRRIRVIPTNDSYDEYVLQRGEDDFALIGFLRGRWGRLS